MSSILQYDMLNESHADFFEDKFKDEIIMEDNALQEICFSESILELQEVNRKLAQLLFKKEELTTQIIGALDHDHEGQKTYEYGVFKIEVKTPFVYSLNKKLYESREINLPENFNPIKESVSYTIDKKLCDKYLSDAPEGVRETLIELIEKKPGKASVIIKENV